MIFFAEYTNNGVFCVLVPHPYDSRIKIIEFYGIWIVFGDEVG